MSLNNNKASRLSYAGRHPDLQSGTPISLREVKPAELFFNDAVDPFRQKQRAASTQTEKERRDSSKGSLMVKLHKPFPQLKPASAHSQIRKSFNQAWIQERKRAAFEQLKHQEQQRHASNEEPEYNIQPQGYEIS